MALLVGIFVGGCVAIALLAFFSITLNRQMLAKHPGRKPYAWGYFLALFTVAAGALSIPFGLMDYTRDGWMVYTGLGTMWLGALLYRRNRWAWLLFVFLQFNPPGWIINGFYLYRRWGEMRGDSSSNENSSALASIARSIPYFSVGGLIDWWKRQSTALRSWIFISGVWIALVWIYVMIFEPFGHNMYEDEYLKLGFIMCIPIAGGGIKFAYDRAVR